MHLQVRALSWKTHRMTLPRRFPVKTLAEFISYAMANAGKINVASFGVVLARSAGTRFHGE